ncbi:hypothetical protein B0A52_07335 [Exophiala mesophila]|uniref:BTB domain-containing protein n=1 Tax=Exophiala mesophila TaxID=212818 RepID=A0A438MX84_EXOME|nr:hypothetical protein B0A52_07335 [Exophiala mesophila]
MAASNGSFPNYKDADVSIKIDPFEEYRLHSQVLRFHSSFFANEFEKNPCIPSAKNARSGQTVLAFFEWVPSDDTTNKQSQIDQVRSWDDELGQFVRVDLTSSGKRKNPKSSLPQPTYFPAGNINKTTSPNQLWRWLFGAFYNITPRFDESNLTELVDDCIHLAQYAKLIGSMDHVRNCIDLVLLRQDTKLWNSILKNPALWIEISERVQSPSIFCEAGSHLVGNWHGMSNQEKNEVNSNIRSVLASKAEELERAKESLELRLLGHYPAFLMREATSRPGRPTYSQDIYMWQSIAFFRQWFAQCISEKRTRCAPDGGLAFYTCLSKGGQAYLTHLDFKEFHRHFPMSVKACMVLEANMTLFKDDIKPFMEPLMKENTHVKRADKKGITWLTCVDFVKQDLTWHEELTEPNVVTNTPNDDLDRTYRVVEEEMAEEMAQSIREGKKSTKALKTPKKPRKHPRVLPPPAGFEPDNDLLKVPATTPAVDTDAANVATSTPARPVDDVEIDNGSPTRPFKKRRLLVKKKRTDTDTMNDKGKESIRGSTKDPIVDGVNDTVADDDKDSPKDIDKDEIIDTQVEEDEDSLFFSDTRGLNNGDEESLFFPETRRLKKGNHSDDSDDDDTEYVDDNMEAD